MRVEKTDSNSTQDSLQTAKAAPIGRGNHPNTRLTLARYQFKAGESGNPSGRPKNDKAREIARAIFEQNPEAIYQAMGKALLNGKTGAFRELAERAYGRVPQALEIAGPDGGPVEYQNLTEQQLNDRIGEVQDELDRNLGEAKLEERIKALQERLFNLRMSNNG
jgi:Family of unknown function (DUF5681)